MKYLYLICLIAGLAAVSLNCQWEPPHDNPFDPANSGYSPKGSLRLTITDTTGTAIDSAEVRIESLGQITWSDDNGEANFAEIDTGSHTVTAFRRELYGIAYHLESIIVNILECDTTDTTLQLLATPPSPDSLYVQVNNQSNLPIPNALVNIQGEGMFARTDENGLASFANLNTGDIWVTAERRDGEEYPDYALDSAEVYIRVGEPTYHTFVLDALPIFTEATVTSHSILLAHVVDPTVRLVLRAKVVDPDGLTDIEYVTWSFQEMGDTLTFQHDSTYFEDIIESDDFPEGNIDAAVGQNFEFRAIDRKSKTVTTDATLTRILKGRIELDPILPRQRPRLDWRYQFNDDFNDTRSINYLIRIISSDYLEKDIVHYERFLRANDTPTQSHTVEDSLSPGDYRVYLWVIDKSGNTSRDKYESLIL